MITFEEALEKVSFGIQQIVYPEQPQSLYQPISYLLSLKGKKVRPAITLLACNLFQDDADQAINQALAWEIFHNFTLMHDDVMDKADLRRGQPTVHKKWNENTAILSGDSMLILSYSYVAKSPEKYLKTLLDLFSKTADEICAGQQYDMDFEKRTEVKEEEYVKMICLKTAVMIGACFQSGAIIGGAGKEDQQNLYEFGINLGIAFQIRDDLLDIYGNPQVFGKKPGGDILCNKKTYLLVKVLTEAGEKDKTELLQWLKSNEQTSEKIERITAIYDKYKIPQIAEKAIQYYYTKALDAFSAVSVSSERKKILFDFARDLMSRES